MGAFGLRSWIWNNWWKTALLLAGFPVLLLVLGYAVALLLVAFAAEDVVGGLAAALRQLPVVLPILVAASLLWFLIAWALHQRILDGLSGARPVTRQEQPRLWNALENLAISRGMRMPRLAVIDSPARNAFASGLSARQGAVTVTTGLLEALDDRELEAVLAHELTHIRNGDARLAVVAAVFAGIISLPFQVIFRSGRSLAEPWRIGLPRRRSSSSSSSDSSSGKGGGGAAIVLLLLALLLIVLAHLAVIGLRFALSRNREFLADAGAVELTRDPDAMIAALRKVAGHSAMPRLPASLQAMLLDSEEGVLGHAWLATHPTLEERIAALARYAGGRDLSPQPLGSSFSTTAARMPAP
ncbi:M48 family metalloprotease [Siccirubricoccus sp. KC 17139]|uniref:M48 family metalloprotease n=1 Tax=Siccirubricoccus soli TaxID=2899147 RepID=A0ABT1CZZ6_9PROT|nr:M48 family metalloprotease [Siccirubricoccus soli]MCO6414992.1 M48 family metalloprotease [Siccirubricoccus soli]MCP2681123.1 M48 family metalloprotease [Siccirubricoccus soli]